MVERFLKQTHFESVEDYNKNLEFIIPENFNFAYDVMDAWAEEKPDGLALLWTNDQGEEIRTTFAELKEQSDQAASYLMSLGIGKNDPVMLILKRRYEWWVIMLALCKIGAIVIPATHMLTKKDIVYRNTRASVKAIICVDDAYVTGQIQLAMADSPTVKQYITVTDHGKPIPEGFHDWQSEWQKAPPFARPAFVNENDDTMLMYFTEIGLEESGVNRLIKAAYRLLNLETFLTAGPKEVKAWTYRKGSKAPQCAGVIHSDFERGFIRAEIIKYDDYIHYGSEATVKEAGKMHTEGKDYVFQDGDIVVFRFNV